MSEPPPTKLAFSSTEARVKGCLLLGDDIEMVAWPNICVFYCCLKGAPPEELFYYDCCIIESLTDVETDCFLIPAPAPAI